MQFKRLLCLSSEGTTHQGAQEKSARASMSSRALRYCTDLVRAHRSMLDSFHRFQLRPRRDGRDGAGAGGVVVAQVAGEWKGGEDSSSVGGGRRRGGSAGRGPSCAPVLDAGAEPLVLLLVGHLEPELDQVDPLRH